MNKTIEDYQKETDELISSAEQLFSQLDLEIKQEENGNKSSEIQTISFKLRQTIESLNKLIAELSNDTNLIQSDYSKQVKNLLSELNSKTNEIKGKLQEYKLNEKNNDYDIVLEPNSSRRLPSHNHRSSFYEEDEEEPIPLPTCTECTVGIIKYLSIGIFLLSVLYIIYELWH